MKEFKNQKYIYVRKYPIRKIHVTFPFILIVSIPDKTIIMSVCVYIYIFCIYYFYIFFNKKHFKMNDAPACPMNEFVPSKSKCQGGAHPLPFVAGMPHDKNHRQHT